MHIPEQYADAYKAAFDKAVEKGCSQERAKQVASHFIEQIHLQKTGGKLPRNPRFVVEEITNSVVLVKEHLTSHEGTSEMCEKMFKHYKVKRGWSLDVEWDMRPAGQSLEYVMFEFKRRRAEPTKALKQKTAKPGQTKLDDFENMAPDEQMALIELLKKLGGLG